jgi:hypothetical protein
VFINERVQLLSDEEIADSLSDYLPPSEFAGLSMRFRAELAKLK